MCDFEKYLMGLDSGKFGLPSKHADQVRDVWRQIVERVPNIPIPISGPGGELGFHMTWNGIRYCLELEICACGRIEWFLIDRDDEVYCSREYPDSDGRCFDLIDDGLVKDLIRLISANPGF